MGLFSKKEEINPLENKSAEDLYGSGSFQAENLENSLMNQDEKFKKNQKDIRGRGEKEVNLKRYKDPEGLTVRKMTIGLWFVEHRKMMINTFYGLLVLIGVATWGLFFYTFGSYLLFGIREDQLLLKGIIETNIVDHQYLVSRGAKELKIDRVQILKIDGKYDFLVQIENPNKEYWAEFDYVFFTKNQEFGRARSFILPGEQKFILSLGQEFDFVPLTAGINIENVSWSRINKHTYPDWQEFRNTHLNFKIEDIVFTSAKETLLTEKINLSDLKFTVHNDTPYNYWNINFVILLKGQSNQIVGVNKYVLENVASEGVYNINVAWPGRIADVKNVFVFPEVDVTRDDIYIDF
ncbi:hypothetical protein A2331_04220 [Candidatus Falkowbacteria bacterium RIFOXYB2_FULL_34_18]|uniref:Uncharacterized protein n=1 Tax=Candidatus Falkowbacteria bacterium RIFOXYD2_FULL_34_120 TaxID=1798007 RepID=A0A1F5TNJ1_9BACT|nr:MAG: hypothetical protein A2500_00035 [Candidatus Falkowbacteria bacterium RIFOXYC12_FULL_34_55]OGF28832.1 MAG: hypothetical protein A2331_04220 [Candidatus Falkowbacteria bacterium RIFOXYB2_FULL_34_18]OGF38384.1 MAG: hypothetical protein A2515_06530 [Candidatus Falkowbacteria bacterium RIFOXYD12_FULL_34_57]OGF40374.1 MAG: hypothetical protein A2531_00135 [Candidatus Falkowbacteria bacterium RIFOXYD2_FULL_34_120]